MFFIDRLALCIPVQVQLGATMELWKGTLGDGMKDTDELSALSQQDLLRYAMNVLGFTRRQFAERIGTTRRSLNNWLMPSTSAENREMPEMARRFILELLPREISLGNQCPRCGWIDSNRCVKPSLESDSESAPN